MGIRRKSPICKHERIYTRQMHIIQPGKIYSHGGCDNLPALWYDPTEERWEFSNDGVIFYPISASGSIISGSGSTGEDSRKYGTVIQSTIPMGGNYALSDPYTVTTQGDKLDVFLNGQLLTPRIGGSEGDYSEINSTTIRFHFEVPAQSILTYIIKG